MAKNNDHPLQEQIDELLLMEKRIERKAEQLTEYNDQLQKRVDSTINNVDLAVNKFETRVEHKLERLQKLNAITYDGAINLAKHSKRWMVIFFGFAVIIAMLAGIASWKLHGLLMQLAIGENMLKELDVKLSQTPEIIKYRGRDYIKIIPFSETKFNEAKTKGKKNKWGNYAAVWYPSRK
jgi:hypothetical protein